jgi:sugar O-acyltransferase (sialic acid O-acetyltransferase NeuD family)
MKNQTLGIIGAGVLGQHIAHYAKISNSFDEIIFFDDSEPVGKETIYGIVAGNTNSIKGFIESKKIQHLLIGIGYNHMNARESFFNAYNSKINIPNIVHPSCYIDSTTIMGNGNIFLPGCIFDKGCELGNNLFFNPGCIIAHDNIIKDHSFFGPGVKTSGFVSIGQKCFMGTNTTIIDNKIIASNTQTGAGALITKSIKVSGLYVGAPARQIK